jgi:hypothetical protein
VLYGTGSCCGPSCMSLAPRAWAPLSPGPRNTPGTQVQLLTKSEYDDFPLSAGLLYGWMHSLCLNPGTHLAKVRDQW